MTSVQTFDNRAAVLYGPKDVRIEDRPIPALSANEILVAVTAVGICGSDMHYYRDGYLGDFIVERPLVLGHESAGVVVALGSRVSRHRIGDRVTVEPSRPCGHCDMCSQGSYNLCRRIRFLATPPVDGALARYIAVPEDFAFKTPDDMTDPVAALVEPVSVGLSACLKAHISPGSRVLLTGAGPIGLCTLIAAQASGACDITVVEPSDSRRRRASAMGATRVLEPLELEDVVDEVDAFIECSGARRALESGIRSLRPGGTAVAVGMGAGAISVPMSAIQTRELTLTATFRYANIYERAVMVAGKYHRHLEELIDRTISLEDVAGHMRDSDTEQAALKTIVVPVDANTI